MEGWFFRALLWISGQELSCLANRFLLCVLALRSGSALWETAALCFNYFCILGGFLVLLVWFLRWFSPEVCLGLCMGSVSFLGQIHLFLGKWNSKLSSTHMSGAVLVVQTGQAQIQPFCQQTENWQGFRSVFVDMGEKRLLLLEQMQRWLELGGLAVCSGAAGDWGTSMCCCRVEMAIWD